MPQESDPLLPRQAPPRQALPGESSKRRESSKYGKSIFVTDEMIRAHEARVRRDEKNPLLCLAKMTHVITALMFIGMIVCLIIQWRLPPPGSIHRDEKELTITQRVDAILSDTPLIDGHNDLAIFLRLVYGNHINSKKFHKEFKNGMPFHVDLPRLKQGKVGGSFWSAYTMCPANGSDFSDVNYAEAVAMTLSQIDLLHRLQIEYPDVFSPANLNASGALHEFKTKGKLVSPIGVEGLHQIGNSVSTLRLYRQLGVHYTTLTHNCHNIFADAALVVTDEGVMITAPPLWGGLSKLGTKLITEMNRMGMIVDLSHVSPGTMRAVLAGNSTLKFTGSRAPVIFSHSSAYAICPHPRNVPDDVLQLVKQTNSIVMVNFAPDFVSCTAGNSSTGLPDFDPSNSTLAHVVDHIEYIGRLIGWEHVGLGSDFDGIMSTPEGLDDVSKYPDLVAELLKRGVSDDEAKMVVGGNVLRVWSDVQAISETMHREGVLPMEDDIEQLSLDF